MSLSSNLYAELLGLPDANVRPSYYELLGIEDQEDDQRVIKAAYYQRVAKVSVCQHDASAEACELLLAELAKARDCLMDESSRQEYSERLARRPESRSKPKLTTKEKRQAKAQRHQVRETARQDRLGMLAPRAPFSSALSKSPSAATPATPRTEADRPFDLGSIAVPRVRKRFLDRLKPFLTAEEKVTAILVRGNTTEFQSQVLQSGNACSLALKSYLIETQLHASAAVSVDSAYLADGGIDQRSVSWGPTYLASRISDGKRFAIRILPRNFRQELTPLRHWVNKSQQIESELICHSVESGRDEGRIFLVSDYFAGEDLYRIVNRLGPLSIEQAMSVMLKVTSVLIAAHSRKLRHPELRPGKILVGSNGDVSVRDFALANLIAARKRKLPDPMQIVPMLPPDHVQFAAPENFRKAAKVDVRAEMYSLGCILKYILTGRSTFELTRSTAIVAAQQSEPVGSVAAIRPEIPVVVDQLIRRLTNKDPAKRFADLDQVHRALGEVCQRANISPASGKHWAGIVPPASQSPTRVTDAGKLHTGRLVLSGLAGTAAISVLIGGGLMASKLISARDGISEVKTTPATAVQPPPPKPQPPKPQQPKIVHAEQASEVPEVESVDAFLLD